MVHREAGSDRLPPNMTTIFIETPTIGVILTEGKHLIETLEEILRTQRSYDSLKGRMVII